MRNNKLFYGFALIFLAGVILYIGSTLSRSSFFNKESQGIALLQDSISITGVSQLYSDGYCDIEIIPSNKEQVVFYYDKKLFRNLTEIKGSHLNINMESIKHFAFGFNNHQGDITVKVFTNQLKSITQNGVGTIQNIDTLHIENLEITNAGVGSMKMNVKVNKLIIVNSGVGSIDVNGDASHTEMNNEGTGSIKGIGLINKIAIADNSGIGSIEVHATDTLDMSNTGIGGIRYTGGAFIKNITSEGIGTISKK